MQSKCNTVSLCRTSWHTTRVLWAEINEEERIPKKERKLQKVVTIVAEMLVLENPGIDPGTSRMQSGRSTIWANSPGRIRHWKVMKVKSDHRSKFSNLSNWKEEAWKKSGLQRDSNPWPPRYRCDALPTELWSHTLGPRSTYWLYIFPWSEMMWSSSFQLLKLENLLGCRITLHFHLQLDRSKNMNCFI